MGASDDRDPFLMEIEGQPAALRRAGEALLQQGDRLETLGEAAASRGPIVFTGMGSSHDACYPAVTALAGEGISASGEDAAELLHFHLPAIRPDAILVVVSQSGESAETVKLVERLGTREVRPLVVSVTNGLSNSLAGLADLAFDTRVGSELTPSTMTFGTSLVLLSAVARVLAGRGAADAAAVAERTAADAQIAATEAERLLRNPEVDGARLSEWLGGCTAVVVLGRGSDRAAAEMGALILKEAARLPAESLGTADFRHGPLELAGPELAAIVIATEPETHDLDLRLAVELLAASGAVLWVSTYSDAPHGAEPYEVARLDPLVSSAATVVPTQLLAWRLAVERGFRPGEFTRSAKTTTRE